MAWRGASTVVDDTDDKDADERLIDFVYTLQLRSKLDVARQAVAIKVSCVCAQIVEQFAEQFVTVFFCFCIVWKTLLALVILCDVVSLLRKTTLMV